MHLFSWNHLLLLCVDCAAENWLPKAVRHSLDNGLTGLLSTLQLSGTKRHSFIGKGGANGSLSLYSHPPPTFPTQPIAQEDEQVRGELSSCFLPISSNSAVSGGPLPHLMLSRLDYRIQISGM